ncbi:MAG TPA: hypothetical protein PKE55_03565 [Kiritimatiellia bacterium]|nr:hypothetical protein [Kiritimatiellia bacterium]
MTLSLVNLLVFPLVGNLALLFTLWLVYSRRERKLAKPAPEGRLYRCEACSCVYMGKQDLPGAPCPRCGHYNDAIRR